MRFELGLTLAAQHVGVTTSNIAKAVARFEKDGMMTDSYGKAIYDTSLVAGLLIADFGWGADWR